jgi:hypothetical protein
MQWSELEMSVKVPPLDERVVRTLEEFTRNAAGLAVASMDELARAHARPGLQSTPMGFVIYAKCSLCERQEEVKEAGKLPASWYRINCNDYLDKSEYLICSHDCLLKWATALFSKITKRIAKEGY